MAKTKPPIRPPSSGRAKKPKPAKPAAPAPDAAKDFPDPPRQQGDILGNRNL